MTYFSTPPLIERLWTAPDGTVCLLATCATPPMYSITIVRDTKVLQERRLYGDASARMMAEAWATSAAGGHSQIEVGAHPSRAPRSSKV